MQILRQRQFKLDLERRRLLLDEESFKIQQELAALGQHQTSIYPDSEDSHATPFPIDRPQLTPNPQEDCLVIDLTHDAENVQVKLEPPDHGESKNTEISSRQNQDQPRTIKSHNHTWRTTPSKHLREFVFNFSTPRTPVPPPTKQPLPNIFSLSSNLTPLPHVSRDMTNNASRDMTADVSRDMTTDVSTKPSKIVVLKLPERLIPFLRPDSKTATSHSQSKSKSDIFSYTPPPPPSPPHLLRRQPLLAPSPVIKSRSASDPTHGSTARHRTTRRTQPSSRPISKGDRYVQELKTELAALRYPSSLLPLASRRRPRLPAGNYCSPGSSDNSSDISMEEPYNS